MTWKEDATLSGQGRVVFTRAFMLFSRREDTAKDLRIFANEKGKVISLNDWIFFFRSIFYDSLWELPKSSAKSYDISAMFRLSGFSSTGVFFNFSNSQKQYYAIVCALRFKCKKKKKKATKTTFSRSRKTSMTNFRKKHTSLSDTSELSEVKTIKCKSRFV